MPGVSSMICGSSGYVEQNDMLRQNTEQDDGSKLGRWDVGTLPWLAAVSNALEANLCVGLSLRLSVQLHPNCCNPPELSKVLS